MKKNCYIIDGYNVLRCAKKYAELVGDSPNFEDWTNVAYNSAREALLNDVSYLTDNDNMAVIVYDSSLPTHSIQASKHVDVIFSGENTSADETIEKIVHKNANNYIRITVVSNDHIIQSISMKNNALRMSVNDFEMLITCNNKDIKAQTTLDKTIGNKISNRIDKATLNKLENLSIELDNLNTETENE